MSKALIVCLPNTMEFFRSLIPGSTTDTCIRCGQEVMISPQGVAFVETMGPDDFEVMCTSCVQEELPNQPGHALPGAAYAVAQHLGIQEDEAQAVIDLVEKHGLPPKGTHGTQD